MSAVAVETFECPETAAEPIEATEEAIAIIESLGLEGQQTLIKQPDECEEGFATRNPYRLIRKDERFVYGVLCPKQTLLATYKDSPVPLRVLQVAAHASEFFTRLWVLHQPEVEEKDPVLIGCGGDSDYSVDWKTAHILARWGEELETFATLLMRAVSVKRDQLVDQAKAASREVDALTDSEILEKGPDAKIVLREW